MSESYKFEELTHMAGYEATARTDVAATPERVWAALTDPKQIAVYMQGSKVTTTWEVGTPITWDGEYDGRAYQDTLVYTLTADGDDTHLELTQDGNESEEQAEQFSQNWQSMLDGLKTHVEG
jgi:uncharacterized protein YndB with AHSA1/START domain